MSDHDKDDLDRLVDRLSIDDPLMRPVVEQAGERARVVRPFLDARHHRGWTQRDLAAASGVAQPVIARFECGDSDPKITTLNKLAAALGFEYRLLPIDPKAG